jgi:hypothetical protein
MGRRPEANTALFRADWHGGLLVAEICQKHTLTKDQVVRLRISLELPPRLDRSARRRVSVEPVPSEEEIARRAAEIRAGWTDDVHLKRMGIVEKPYEIPTDVETPPDFDPRWYD